MGEKVGFWVVMLQGERSVQVKLKPLLLSLQPNLLFENFPAILSLISFL